MVRNADPVPGTDFDRIAAILAFAVPLLVYVATVCPTVYLVDSGEFALNAYTLGVCHPTGYPTYTILGYLFTHAVPFGSVAMRANLMSALFAAAACGMLFLLLRRVKVGPAAAFAASMLFGFSRVFWSQATVAEVWTLQALLVILILFFALRFAENPVPRRLYALAFLCGLSLTNHMTTVLLLPFVAAFAFSVGRECFSRGTVLRAVCWGCVGLIPYTYLPIRAAMNPIINWGEPDTLRRFYQHLSGSQFRGLMFRDPPSVLWANFKQYLLIPYAQFSVPVGKYALPLVWILPIGIYAMWRSSRSLTALAVCMWTVNVFWSVNYHIVDIESYYIPSCIVLAAFFAFGLEWILQRAAPLKRALAVAVVGVPIIVAGANYAAMDRSDCYLVENFVRDVLGPLEEGSLLISCGDGVCSAIEYMQFVEGYRRDVAVVDRNLLRGWYPHSEEWSNSWYLHTVDRAELAVSRVYRDRRWSKPQIVQEHPLQVVLRQQVGKRPVYYSCNAATLQRIPRDHHLLKHIRAEYDVVPLGLVYEIVPKGSKYPLSAVTVRNEMAWDTFTRADISTTDFCSPFAQELPRRYAQCRAVLGKCQLACGRYKEACDSFSYAYRTDPETSTALTGLGLANLSLRRPNRAVRLFENALAVDPNDDVARAGLEAARSALQDTAP